MSKYKNRITVVDGIKFHSAKEAIRWQQLRILERAGAISSLQRQPAFALEVAGVKIATYRADFAYVENGQQVAEDAKGFETPVFKLKWKMVKALYPQWKFVTT